MTTNQTIDGVPRAVIAAFAKIADHYSDAEDDSFEPWQDAVMHDELRLTLGQFRELRALLDAPACSACNDTGRMHEPGCEPGACTACFERTAAQPHGMPWACAHEWTDDGEHLLVCTACGAQEDHDPGWKDMASAPTDGTMLRLLVEFEEHPTEDADQAVTIGANNFDNNGEDSWQFAGWCWSHDHFTEGKGTPVGWLPMLDEPKLRAPAQTAEAR